MRLRIIDAFTDRPFAGNPAGVCLLDGDAWPDEAWMRQVAAELNLPMTAFAYRLPEGGEADWALRWFTSMIEEKLCGHATLATAHALHTDRGSPGVVRFSTRSGILPTHTADDGAITLDFPAARLTEVPVSDALAEALGVQPEATYSAAALRDIVALLDTEASVRTVTPDFAALAQLKRREDLRGITVTAAATDPGGGYDFVSRFFSPGDGIDEDSVTGSAHTALAPYWSERLGRERLAGLQVSARTGVVGTEVRGDRVLLTGYAVTVMDGTLLSAAG